MLVPDLTDQSVAFFGVVAEGEEIFPLLLHLLRQCPGIAVQDADQQADILVSTPHLLPDSLILSAALQAHGAAPPERRRIWEQVRDQIGYLAPMAHSGIRSLIMEPNQELTSFSAAGITFHLARLSPLQRAVVVSELYHAIHPPGSPDLPWWKERGGTLMAGRGWNEVSADTLADAEELLSWLEGYPQAPQLRLGSDWTLLGEAISDPELVQRILIRCFEESTQVSVSRDQLTVSGLPRITLSGPWSVYREASKQVLKAHYGDIVTATKPLTIDLGRLAQIDRDYGKGGWLMAMVLESAARELPSQGLPQVSIVGAIAIRATVRCSHMATDRSLKGLRQLLATWRHFTELDTIRIA